MKKKLQYQLIDQINAKIEVDKHDLIIAGPCSAESESQVFKTANSLKKIGVKIFRAGVWKPRSSPAAFEGSGEIALQWLCRVKNELGMLVSTEVGSPRHVELALQYGIDIVWLGARTTVNPFLVQEIANALSGSDLGVLVKNPVVPDISLWIGAIERLRCVGIRGIGAVHRGFSAYKSRVYKNPPNWHIAGELKERMPDIPVLTDPSHIAGCISLLEKVCRISSLLGFDGLMIEAHFNPKIALSDPFQQINAAELGSILAAISDVGGYSKKDQIRYTEALWDEIYNGDKSLQELDMWHKLIINRLKLLQK